MTVIIALAAIPIATLLSASLNWAALSPWRRHRNEHWAEQARRLWPARVTAGTMRWTFPLLAVLTLMIFRPGTSLWALFGTGAGALAGAILGSIPSTRETFPRLRWSALLRQSVVGFVIHLFLWIVFVVLAFAMPPELGWQTIALGLVAVALQLYWSRAGWIRLGLRIGLFGPPSDRLLRVVRAATDKAGVSCRAVWTMRIGMCQAMALPLSRELLFSDRLVEVMTDEEIAAICAHELGHLSESRGTLALRLVRGFARLPWLFVIPLHHHLGFFGIYLPVLAMVIIPRLTAGIIRRMETRADKIASTEESNPGTYAEALLRLSEDNLMPVVFPGKGTTHPHTYDRVIAAGVTPDFPRPQAPVRMAWHGFLLTAILGVEVGFFVARHLG